MRNSTTLAFPQQLLKMDLARLKAYRDNLDFYEGSQWLEPQRRRERRLTFNYAKTLIDKSASFVMNGLSFAVDPVDGSPEAAEAARRAEAALWDVYEANNLEQLDFDTEVDCSVLGDAAFKVTWDPLARRVRVSAPDVQGLYVWWLGDDVTRVWRVASRYQLSTEEAQMLYGVHPTQADRRRESTVVEVWTEGEFELWLDNALLEARQRKATPAGLLRDREDHHRRDVRGVLRRVEPLPRVATVARDETIDGRADGVDGAEAEERDRVPDESDAPRSKRREERAHAGASRLAGRRDDGTDQRAERA